VNRIDQETEKEARAHKGCRAIQEEEKEEESSELAVAELARKELRLWTEDSTCYLKLQ
jgi:hypothetical protein